MYIPPAKTTSYSLPSSWVDIVTASRFLGQMKPLTDSYISRLKELAKSAVECSGISASFSKSQGSRS